MVLRAGLDRRDEGRRGPDPAAEDPAAGSFRRLPGRGWRSWPL